MIVFDLKCRTGHVFESWFTSSTAFADQQAAGQIACPLCGDTQVEKAMMAPNIAAKGGGGSKPARDQMRKQMLHAVAAAQAAALRESSWVGTGFAEQARAMHVGDAPHRIIHGQADLRDAKALVAEGVPVMPLLMPIIPPKAIN